MKASDITDAAFLTSVRELAGDAPRWVLVWELAERLGFPEKVVRAKARRLIRRGLLDGCACGCRGDFELTEQGSAAIR